MVSSRARIRLFTPPYSSLLVDEVQPNLQPTLDYCRFLQWKSEPPDEEVCCVLS